MERRETPGALRYGAPMVPGISSGTRAGKWARSWKSRRRSALVEFSDDEGRAYAIAPLSFDRLLVLHYEPQTA